jgi:hypothetical protein
MDFLPAISDLYEGYRGNLMIAVITLIAYAITSGFDVFGWGKEANGNLGNIGYLLISFGIFFALDIVWNLCFIHSRIKVAPKNRFDDGEMMSLGDPWKCGTQYFVGCDIEIPNGWKITDCYVTLDKVMAVYYSDKVLLNPDSATWLSNRTQPEYKLLRWKSPLANQQDCSLTIGKNSNKETFFVSRITIGSINDPKGNNADIETFEFWLCSSKETFISFKQPGLYEVWLSFHWSRFNRTMIAKKFKGYLYVEIKNRYPRVIFRSGNYRDDSDVPKPLPQQTEAQNDNSKR